MSLHIYKLQVGQVTFALIYKLYKRDKIEKGSPNYPFRDIL